MNREEKKNFVDEFRKDIKDNPGVILVNYQGLGVNALNELRRKLRRTDCSMKIIKNRLAARAFSEAGHEDFSDILNSLKGPSAVLLTRKDPSGAVKVFGEYSDESRFMEFKAGIIGQRFYEKIDIEKLAKLPSRQVLLGKTVNVINAPVQMLYNSISGIIRKFMYAVNDLKGRIERGEIKTESGEAEDTAPKIEEKQEEDHGDKE
jgi:large subunit ribosomal protein L10